MGTQRPNRENQTAGTFGRFQSVFIRGLFPTSLRRPGMNKVNQLRVNPLSHGSRLGSQSAPDEIFRDRDRKPWRDLVPWAGEFAGKYLVSAVQVWRVTGDESLKNTIADFVPRLIALQADDGYLGPWPKESRLTGRAPNAGPKGGE